MRDGNSASPLFVLSLVLSSLLPLISARAIVSDAHLVHTQLGIIRGIEQKYADVSLSAFLGVPYARPPTGSRRFGKPEKIQPWSGELEARRPSQTCVYTVDKVFPDFPGAEMWNPPPTSPLSEDCLSMNIWVPPHHDGSVIVWIYGGGFFSGSPSLDLYDGRVLAVKHNKIVININYRLGPFGFLYLGADSEIPGNMGLLDQQLALRWIHDHITSFGGDPSRVTLMGESAGAASVTAHLFAPDSHKTFSKIIAKSGAITSSWATRSKEAMLDMTLELAKLVNCTDKISIDKTSIARCLRKIPAVALQNYSDFITLDLPMAFAFTPVEEDNNFFKGNVFDKLRRRDFKKDVSAIVGTVKDEGTYWLPYYMAETHFGFRFNHTISSEDPQNRALINDVQYKSSLKAFMPYFGNSPLVEHALMHAYQDISHGQSQQEKLRDGVARFLGDYFFTCGLVDFADILADNIYGPVYMYYFTMRSSSNPWPKWMGVMHGYEIEYAFGWPLRRPNLYAKDKLEIEQRFSEIIMNMWVDFTNSNSPAPYWPKYNRIERKSLVLSEELTTGVHRIHVDVHGPHCRLIDESKAVVGQMSNVECRTRRTGPKAEAAQSVASFSPFYALTLTILYLEIL